MRVMVLTFGDANQASSCYRVFQYIEPLRGLGITLETKRANTFRDWRSLAEYDVVVVQKRLYSTGKVRAIRRHSRRLIYDVDDAIWHPHGKPHSWLTRMRTAWRLRAIVSQADQCTAANTVLATHLRRWSTHVTVLPMTLDETVWQPRRVKSREAAVRVGWAGHPVNFPYLQAIAPALAAARESCPNVQFVIYSGSKPNLPGVEYEYLPFAPEKERDAIGSFDIGLLPLPTGNAFAAGKSPIKGLQYMACGIPTIATPLGATEAMFEEGATALFAQTIADWTRHITDLAANAERRQKMGHSARGVFEAGYSLGANLQRYADLLRKSED